MIKPVFFGVPSWGSSNDKLPTNMLAKIDMLIGNLSVDDSPIRHLKFGRIFLKIWYIRYPITNIIISENRKGKKKWMIRYKILYAFALYIFIQIINWNIIKKKNWNSLKKIELHFLQTIKKNISLHDPIKNKIKCWNSLKKDKITFSIKKTHPYMDSIFIGSASIHSRYRDPRHNI